MHEFLMWITDMKVKSKKVHHQANKMVSNIVQQYKRDREDVKYEKMKYFRMFF